MVLFLKKTTEWRRYPVVISFSKHCYWKVIWTASRTRSPQAGHVYSPTASAHWSPCRCPTS
jgi:hypothetical protein